MMEKTLRWLSLFLLLVFASLLVGPLPAKADGGLVTPYDLWAHLREGQQIAVITLKTQETAKVDLFISILDATGESHEVTFFLPLGAGAADFSVVEQGINVFNQQTTIELDSRIQSYALDKYVVLNTLFGGTLLANGALLVPLWAPLLLSGCNMVGGPKPMSTFQTTSSQISIYAVDKNTDLEALITTTGLDSSVQQVLSRLRGQQIAVVKLRTQPKVEEPPTPAEGQPAGEPGIHLAWTASLVSSESGSIYSYPLGTGASWSKPIELTRVYVVATPGIDFDVSYPKLGLDESGYNKDIQSRITDYYDKPAYAVDEARGNFGRVWRATYTQSNSAEDIVVTTRAQTAMSRIYAGIQGNALYLALIMALVLGLIFWVLAWQLLMPRLIGRERDPKKRLRWYYSLIYPAINFGLIIIPGVILFGLFNLGLAVASLVILFLLFAGISILVFNFVHARHLDISRGRALVTFIDVTLASNACYLVLALVLAKVIGII